MVDKEVPQSQEGKEPRLYNFDEIVKSKNCVKCGNKLPGEDNYCVYCGSNEFTEVTEKRVCSKSVGSLFDILVELGRASEKGSYLYHPLDQNLNLFRIIKKTLINYYPNAIVELVDSGKSVSVEII
jgi:hypothetical protein